MLPARAPPAACSLAAAQRRTPAARTLVVVVARTRAAPAALAGAAAARQPRLASGAARRQPWHRAVQLLLRRPSAHRDDGTDTVEGGERLASLSKVPGMRAYVLCLAFYVGAVAHAVGEACTGAAPLALSPRELLVCFIAALCLLAAVLAVRLLLPRYTLVSLTVRAAPPRLSLPRSVAHVSPAAVPLAPDDTRTAPPTARRWRCRRAA
jgi:hypothetical protein